MEYLYLVWLGLFIILVLIEIFTLRLIAVWFAGGVLFAFVLALFGYSVLLQVPAFIALSLILLFSRPCLRRFLEKENKEINNEEI